MPALIALAVIVLATFAAAQPAGVSALALYCPEAPIYGASPYVSAEGGGGWVKVDVVVCRQDVYYVHYANDGTDRPVWMQIIRVSSSPNAAEGWKHTTGGIVRDVSTPTQKVGHICASRYYTAHNYVAYTLSPDCVYGPAIPGSTAPNSGEYNIGGAVRAESFGIGIHAAGNGVTMEALWTETIPRMHISLNLLKASSVKWISYIYDGGDTTLGNIWGSAAWDWAYGLLIIAKPNSNFYLGAAASASFWRCKLPLLHWCPMIELSKAHTAWFLSP